VEGFVPTLPEHIQRKRRELSDKKKEGIRSQIERGNANVYKLAKQFDWVPTQHAGIKAGMRS
jgi:hypothetical protein